MSRKNRIPKFPESYIADKSYEYNQSKSMERNQKKSTLLTLQYLYDDKLDKLGHVDILEDIFHLILDLGCGTGFSTEIFLEDGFRVIGIDILIDMLSKAKDKKKELTNQKNLEYILADINHIPLKNNSIDHIVSVSAYNFITYNKTDSNEKIKTINSTATYLNTILKTNGRIVIEFYPQNDEELKLFSSSFINNGFKGYIIKQNPNQKGGQTFLLLKKC